MKLPVPKGKIIISVYKFADQTGQYKANASATSFSTSVTQGATSMLLETLRESKWFIPLEREGLNNLLNERKILMAKLKSDGKEDALPKLYHAPILLEGGIISYDTNVSTGGLGARYLGIGGSTQYQKDQVAIYLRAVDVNRGDIQLAVSTTKSILSEEIQFGVFKFIDTDKLLEGELGYTRNEPPQLCVLEAIEKAVLSLIIEGIFDHKWELKNKEDIKNPVIRKYLEEKGGESPDDIIERFLSQNISKNQSDNGCIDLTALPDNEPLPFVDYSTQTQTDQQTTGSKDIAAGFSSENGTNITNDETPTSLNYRQIQQTRKKIVFETASKSKRTVSLKPLILLNAIN